jgi:hypothetical protein
MGLLMLHCPTTGRGFDAGIDTNDLAFKRMPDRMRTSRCPHCGREHPWRLGDAHVLDAMNDSKPYIGLPRHLDSRH